MTRESHIQALYTIRTHLCAYRRVNDRDVCDCKFGVTADTLRRKDVQEDGSGCPETLLAARLLRVMTDDEYAKLVDRLHSRSLRGYG